MKKILFIPAFILFSIFSFSQDLNWLMHISNVNNDIDVHTMALDNSGGVYIGGSQNHFGETAADQVLFGGAIPFPPVDDQDGFLAKYDVTGSQVWFDIFPSPHNSTGFSPLDMVVDNGFLYVVGSFTHSNAPGVDFDPGTGTDFLTSENNSGSDLFLAKYKTSDGTLVWAYSAGSPSGGGDVANGIAIDASGNAYITGEVRNASTPINFDLKDPSNSSNSLGIASKTHLYLAKYSPDGDFLWRSNIQNSIDNSGGHIAIDKTNNWVYISGGVGKNTSNINPRFTSAPGVPFLSQSLIVNSSADGFIAKFKTDGEFLWAKNIAKGSSSNYINEMDLDENGNIYVISNFQNSIDVDPSASSTNFTSNGSIDFFVGKYNSDGDYQWAYQLGNTNADFGYSIDVSPARNGEILIGGKINGSQDYNPSGVGGAAIKGTANYNLFFGVYDLNFKYKGGHAIGSASTAYNNYAKKVILDDNDPGPCGKIYVYGHNSANSTQDFDPDNTAANITSTGSKDNGFLAMYDCIVPLPVELIEFNATPEEQKVRLDWATSTEINNDYFEVQRSKNGSDFETVDIVQGAGNSITQENYLTFDNRPYYGTSFYRLKQVDFDGKFKYSEIKMVNFENSNSLSIFPNPATDVISIQGDFELAKIYTANGKLIKIFSTNSTSISNLINGVYFVKIEQNNIITSKKLIVIH